MKKIISALERIRKYKSLKYIVVIVIATITIGFVGDNSIMSHISNVDKINELKEEISFYQKRYEHDQARLIDLKNDPKAVEKVARERYFMKNDNEDIFVLSDSKSSN